jgi:hypothetical protein
MNKLTSIGFGIFCSALAAPAGALVIGTANTDSNSIPFGSQSGGSFFQQVYSASSFAGPTAISRLSFYNSHSPGTSTPLSDTFTIFLSVTNAAIPTFDTSAFAFPDGSFTQVFTGKLSALADGRLDIDLSTIFNYDPAQGNLMLTVRDFDFGSGGNLFLDAYRNTGVTNERISAFPFDFNQGLVTGFNEGLAAAPEPATWAMFIGGMSLAGATLRRRQRVTMRFA